jgi:ATPase family associated with various cellular activities (AAA)
MSDELKDAEDFANTTNNFDDSTSKRPESGLQRATPGEEAPRSPKESMGPGQLSQYALYGQGYMATTPTVSCLPPGAYDICVDNHGVFVVPSLSSSGLLLELPEMRSDDVINIVENFWSNEKDYKEGNEFVVGGARFSAGLLIYGPPGSGKSCTIKIVSNKLIERGGTVFFGSSNPSNVMAFLTDFSRVEKDRKCIVILEDIDSLIRNYGESPYLEMLDSAKTINNVMFIATTNYPELLDPRIYNRPGRFSHVIKIGMPTEKAREAYLKAILKNHRDIAYIVEHTEQFTIDHLTALINSVYREKKELKIEIQRLRTLFKVPVAGNQVKLGISTDQNDEGSM